MDNPHTGTEMPQAEAIIAMQDRGDRPACQAALETADQADPAQRRRIYRRWWIRGIAAQRPARADQYAAAHNGEGSWTAVGAA
ncbi:hypothetical protein [Streptomyces sp. NRRL F-2890]|uniref:hypothetical protein n=1 Tax=Streptomyces sp. NRRL F-2890 TaxID=1463845 RepID=UPI0004C9293E|nr:hypothetical protein [Streptomyces sp. NRRL F-2890]